MAFVNKQPTLYVNLLTFLLTLTTSMCTSLQIQANDNQANYFESCPKGYQVGCWFLVGLAVVQSILHKQVISLDIFNIALWNFKIVTVMKLKSVQVLLSVKIWRAEMTSYHCLELVILIPSIQRLQLYPNDNRATPLAPCSRVSGGSGTAALIKLWQCGTFIMSIMPLFGIWPCVWVRLTKDMNL